MPSKPTNRNGWWNRPGCSGKALFMSAQFTIKTDDFSRQEIADFLEEHLADMRAVSPPESKHALSLKALKQSDMTFWTLWEGPQLAGCGALKELDPTHAEIKSMRSALTHRGRGIGKRMLQHILDTARQRGYTRLSLETGSMPFFVPARSLYEAFGFEYCPPFADYKPDPYSMFMTLLL